MIIRYLHRLLQKLQTFYTNIYNLPCVRKFYKKVVMFVTYYKKHHLNICKGNFLGYKHGFNFVTSL
jgi:hypothetical protein